MSEAFFTATIAVLAAVSVSVPVAYFFASFRRATSLRAERVELLDGQRRVRALLTARDALGLSFFDESGRILAAFSNMAVGQAGVALYGPDRRPRVMLTLGADGLAGLSVGDDRGTTRAILGVDQTGRPALLLNDRNGETYWTTPAPPP